MKKSLERIGATILVSGQITGAVAALWSYVLCFQVNGGGKYGIISFLLTLLLPGIAQVAWAWWAIVHGNPYIWIVLASVILWVSGIAIMSASEKK
jgi:hypothetical protein